LFECEDKHYENPVFEKRLKRKPFSMDNTDSHSEPQFKKLCSAPLNAHATSLNNARNSPTTPTLSALVSSPSTPLLLRSLASAVSQLRNNIYCKQVRQFAHEQGICTPAEFCPFILQIPSEKKDDNTCSILTTSLFHANNLHCGPHRNTTFSAFLPDLGRAIVVVGEPSNFIQPSNQLIVGHVSKMFDFHTSQNNQVQRNLSFNSWSHNAHNAYNQHLNSCAPFGANGKENSFLSSVQFGGCNSPIESSSSSNTNDDSSSALNTKQRLRAFEACMQQLLQLLTDVGFDLVAVVHSNNSTYNAATKSTLNKQANRESWHCVKAVQNAKAKCAKSFELQRNALQASPNPRITEYCVSSDPSAEISSTKDICMDGQPQLPSLQLWRLTYSTPTNSFGTPSLLSGCTLMR